MQDFELVVYEVIHLANRRPIAFKSALRDEFDEEVPDAITPEKLIKGYELISVNIVPEAPKSEIDEWLRSSDSLSQIRKNSQQLERVRNNLKEKYESEFWEL